MLTWKVLIEEKDPNVQLSIPRSVRILIERLKASSQSANHLYWGVAFGLKGVPYGYDVTQADMRYYLRSVITGPVAHSNAKCKAKHAQKSRRYKLRFQELLLTIRLTLPIPVVLDRRLWEALKEIQISKPLNNYIGPLTVSLPTECYPNLTTIPLPCVDMKSNCRKLLQLFRLIAELMLNQEKLTQHLKMTKGTQGKSPKKELQKEELPKLAQSLNKQEWEDCAYNAEDFDTSGSTPFKDLNELFSNSTCGNVKGGVQP